MVKKFLLLTTLTFSILGHTLSFGKAKKLNQSQLVGILVDLELTKALIYQEINNPSPQEELLLEQQANLIYQAHGTEAINFKKSYESFLANSELLTSLYDALIEALEKLFQKDNLHQIP